ncbi:formimidoylglutamate deiminase [Microbacterium sp. RD1]|uniref:formimidoylglutamate deiminase n=1 Tax=Microbacterium sp. RD1 TaxID=3457313 RepID=UPI003FA5A0C5
MSAYWLEHAVVGGEVRSGVRVEEERGRIRSVAAGPAEPGDTRLAGLTLPGIANAHSHAFHRALRGRTHDDGGDFWTWRQRMYAAASALDPERYHALASAFYAELLEAGYTAVGEFHYVHRDPTTVMADAVAQAARDSGIRLTLLDTLYRYGGRNGSGRPLALSDAQTLFGGGDVDVWLGRHESLASGGTVRRGAAVHSLRAADPDDVQRVVEATAGEPLHAHVSEQPAENAQVRAAFGQTPVRLLREAGALGARFTAVHATHVTADDVADLSGSFVCMCPTTERDLADGLGPARAFADAGARIVIGSDQHAVVDPFDELRALEGHERLRSGRRGVFSPAELVRAATVDGYASLGWRGGLEPGAECDLVTLRLNTPRTAGAEPGQLWLAASAADVAQVVVGGVRVVREGRARVDVGARLAEAIGEVWG